MRKITILLLCCGLMLCSACNKAEHSYIESQSAVSETADTEQVSEIPTEEEKETVSTESTPPQSTTTVINEPPKEETKITNTSSNTSSNTETTITKEQVTEEIEIADSTEVERLVIKYILDCSYQDSEHTNEAKAREYYQNYIQNQTPVGLGVKGIFELGNIIDGSGEDSEERRKRIEAEENASNLGTLIGLTAGIISALAEDNSDELPEELEDEQNEISMNL